MAIESKHSLIAVRLPMLLTNAMMVSEHSNLQIRDDNGHHRQAMLPQLKFDGLGFPLVQRQYRICQVDKREANAKGRKALQQPAERTSAKPRAAIESLSAMVCAVGCLACSTRCSLQNPHCSLHQGKAYSSMMSFAEVLWYFLEASNSAILWIYENMIKFLIKPTNRRK